MKRLRFGASARRELQDAFHFYESNQDGLGERFLVAVRSAAQKIRTQPSTGRVAPHGMRRCPVSGFPYHLIFEEQDDVIYVFAVAHLRREPDYWVDRLPDK